MGKHTVAPYEGVIEREVVYPLARGRDTRPFYVEDTPIYVVVPQRGMRGFDEATMWRSYRGALTYFRAFRAQLEARASYRRYHLSRDGTPLGPYYSLWNVGPYTFAPHKVVWREVQDPKHFAVSYLGMREDPYLGLVPVVPDHKLYFVPCSTAEEAHYLCAFLNSPAVRAFITGYAVSTQIASHVTEYINVPVYDPSNPLHGVLAQISATISEERRDATAQEQASIEEIVEQLLPPVQT